MKQWVFGMTSRWWSEQSEMAREVSGGLVYKAKSDDGEVNDGVVKTFIWGLD